MTAGVAEVEVVSAAYVVERASAAPDSVGTVVWHVPPGELVLHYNIRSEVEPDPDLEASITARGVLVPIIGYVRDGELRVHMGRRRAFCAARVGRPWVPVVLTAAPHEEDQLEDQLVENEHRRPNTAADRARAVRQLSLLGVTPEQLVARTALRRSDVDAALAVAASPVATAAAAARPDMDLVEAAAVAEFDTDPATVKALTAAAGTGAFDHALQIARDERAVAAEKTRVLEQLRAVGVTAVEDMDWQRYRRLIELGITPGKHRRCPGHAGYARVTWDRDGRPAGAPEYICTEPGHHSTSSASGGAAPTLEAEEARHRRAEVVAGNAAWRSATEVRRRWLRDFAHRSRPPAGAEAFVAAALLRLDWDVIEKALHHEHVLLREMLAPPGSDEPVPDAAGRSERDVLAERAATMPAKRALVLAAATLLAAWEHTADEHTWRDHPHDPIGGHRGVDRFYLGQMAAWGYPLSEIEQLVVEGTQPTETSS